MQGSLDQCHAHFLGGKSVPDAPQYRSFLSVPDLSGVQCYDKHKQVQNYKFSHQIENYVTVPLYVAFPSVQNLEVGGNYIPLSVLHKARYAVGPVLDPTPIMTNCCLIRL